MTVNKIIQEDLLEIYNSGIDWQKFKNKTVLISGANGFLAAYMVEMLLYVSLNQQSNITVIALVRNFEKAKKRFEDYLQFDNLKFIVSDVTEKIDYESKIDYIVHAASQASPKYYATDPIGTINANVAGTINMLEVANKNDVEALLYFSSAEVYGQVDESISLKETSYGIVDPLLVRSCYAESKRMGENLCVSYSHQYKIKSKIVRPFHTYGPKMDLSDGRVFVDFVANILAGKEILMKSDGTARRAYCYISDAVEAYFKVLLNGEENNAYNVGNPNNEFSVIELANLIVSIAPNKVKVVRSYLNDDNYLPSKVNRVVPDICKINKLGWEPKVSARDGFYRTIMSYNI
jgi:UDP-glucuronate decarboxylase